MCRALRLAPLQGGMLGHGHVPALVLCPLQAGKEGKARSRKRRDEDDEEGRGGIEEPSAGEPAPRQRETREAARYCSGILTPHSSLLPST